jgi:threonine dehydratase
MPLDLIFSTLMFGVMAVSAGLFALMMMQAARSVRAGNMTIARSTSVVLRAALAALRAGAYEPADGERIAVVLCGANTDPSDLIVNR